MNIQRFKFGLFGILILSTSLSFGVNRSWNGGSGNFNQASNWSPAGSPAAGDNLTITGGSGGGWNITLSASATINNLTITATGGGSRIIWLSANGNVLTVNGTTTASGGSSDYVVFDADGAPGGFVFNGNVSWAASGNGYCDIRANTLNEGAMTFNANLTTGMRVYTQPGIEPSFIFDAAGAQSWTFNSTWYYMIPASIIIGQSNTPSVTFTGTGNDYRVNVYDGNFSMVANASLNCRYRLLSWMSSGTFTMGAGSYLTLSAANTMPIDQYTSYNFAATSTTEYNSPWWQDMLNGTVAYGNLIASGGGGAYKYSNGTTTVQGDFTVAASTVYNPWAGVGLNMDGDCIINGTFFGDGNLSSLTHTVAGDWTNSGTFTRESSTITLDGSAAQLMNGSVITTFNNLTVNNTSAAGVTLSKQENVAAALTLTDGIVYTAGANFLQVESTGSSTSGSTASFVDGPMRKVGATNFTFPVGDGTIWARAALINISSSSTFEVTYFDKDPTLDGYDRSVVTAPLIYASQIEYWDISRVAGTGTAVVYLSWEDNIRSGITDQTPSDLRVAHWNGSSWEDRGHVSNSGSLPTGWVSSLVNSSFSPYTFGSLTLPAINPLPIELLYFNADCNSDNSVLLTWSTASEDNNSYFTVQGSADGRKFTNLLQVEGANMSQEIKDYSVEVKDHGDWNYYRLTQTDNDGTETVASDMVAVNCSELSQSSIYPNPANENIVVYIPDISFGSSIEIINMQGQMILQYDAGQNHNTLDVSGLATGSYLVRIRNTGSVSYHKLQIK